MKITPLGSATPSFSGLQRVTYKAVATKFEKELLALKNCVQNGDTFVKSESQPIVKTVTRVLNSKKQIVGLNNSFPDGSYFGVRVFPDGTIFNYKTYKYEHRLFGEKMGVKVHVVKNKQNYTITYDEAYRENGTQNLPSVKKLNEETKRNYREFMTKHYPALKDYLIDDLIAY